MDSHRAWLVLSPSGLSVQTLKVKLYFIPLLDQSAQHLPSLKVGFWIHSPIIYLSVQAHTLEGNDIAGINLP